MHFIYLLARIFPFLAVPLAYILAQLGLFFRRRKDPTQHVFWGGAVFLCLLALCWLVFRGDLHSDAWVRTVFDPN